MSKFKTQFKLWFCVGHFGRVGDLRSMALNKPVVIYRDGCPAFREPRKVLGISAAVAQGHGTYEVTFEGVQTPFFVGSNDCFGVF